MGASGAAMIVSGLLSAKGSHDTRKAEMNAGEERREAKREIIAERARSKQEVETARRRKQIEELSRRGRRASILTSPKGVEDQLGSIARPEIKAVETLG